MPVESLKDRGSVVIEEYLQTMYALRSDGQPIKAITLVKWLGSSPSTVHATLARMKRDKLVKINRKKEINLTADGLAWAERLMRRHRLVEWFLCEKLGVSWHEVHKHAHVLEHALTPLVEEKLSQYLNYPEACPHGTPLVKNANSFPTGMKSLDQFEIGDEAQIVFISEILEESVELMRFLEEKNVIPGQRHDVVEKVSITQTLVLKSETGTATLTVDIASRIGAIKTN